MLRCLLVWPFVFFLFTWHNAVKFSLVTAPASNTNRSIASMYIVVIQGVCQATIVFTAVSWSLYVSFCPPYLYLVDRLDHQSTWTIHNLFCYLGIFQTNFENKLTKMLVWWTKCNVLQIGVAVFRNRGPGKIQWNRLVAESSRKEVGSNKHQLTQINMSFSKENVCWGKQVQRELTDREGGVTNRVIFPESLFVESVYFSAGLGVSATTTTKATTRTVWHR